LWFSAPGAGWQSVFSDSYLWHVVRFSFWQASLCAVALAAFLALWFSAPGAGWQSVFSDSYLWHVVRFSFWQASL
ncbi:hypothetical protein C7D72_29835, partial [Klebsiella pneumoniae]